VATHVVLFPDKERAFGSDFLVAPHQKTDCRRMPKVDANEIEVFLVEVKAAAGMTSKETYGHEVLASAAVEQSFELTPVQVRERVIGSVAVLDHQRLESLDMGAMPRFVGLDVSEQNSAELG